MKGQKFTCLALVMLLSFLLMAMGAPLRQLQTASWPPMLRPGRPPPCAAAL